MKKVSEQRITLRNAFVIADDVLRQGVQSISELINVNGEINLDFADVTAIMSNAGNAHMGVGQANGKDKAEQAAMMAISSPLLETSIKGAKGIIINFTGSPDIGLDEVDIAASIIQREAHPDAMVIWGVAFDETLEDEMKVTVIATGFDSAKKNGFEEAVKVADEGAAEADENNADNGVEADIFEGADVNAATEGKSNSGNGISDSDFEDILDLFRKNN